MNGVYKQLDKWIKSVLPILPDTSLQENILNILQVTKTLESCIIISLIGAFIYKEATIYSLLERVIY